MLNVVIKIQIECKSERKTRQKRHVIHTHTHTLKHIDNGEGQTVGKRYCRKLLAEIGVKAIENAFGPRLKKCHNLCKRRKQSNEPNVAESNNNTLTHVPQLALSFSFSLSITWQQCCLPKKATFSGMNLKKDYIFQWKILNKLMLFMIIRHKSALNF